jgi:hypothetical protein
MKWINGVPDWMHKAGIKAGDLGYLTRQQLESQMRPGAGHTLTSQVWACGMLHAPKNHGEQAIMWYRDRATGKMKRGPMTPSDFSRELIEVALHYFDALALSEEEQNLLRAELRARYSKEAIRRALAEIEKGGCCERRRADGKPLKELSADALRRLPSGQVHVFFFAKPKSPDLDRLKSEWLEFKETITETVIVGDEAEESKDSFYGLRLACIPKILKVFKIQISELFASSPSVRHAMGPISERQAGAKLAAVMAKPEYQETLLAAIETAQMAIVVKVREVLALEEAGSSDVAATRLPDALPTGIPDVGTTVRQDVIQVVNGAVNGKSASPRGFHHHQDLPNTEEKTTPKPSKDGDDDQKPKSVPKEYANAREELKAIYKAKAGELPSIQLWDRLESLLAGKGRSWEDLLAELQTGNHLPNTWKNPAGFLTKFTRELSMEREVSPPQEKPKPKCPICKADNHRGAVMRDGAIVACPACSTPAWIEELTAKLAVGARKRAAP